MASKKVSLDNLDKAIQEILNEYGDEVSANLDEITQKIGKKGAQTLKAESLSAFDSSKKHAKRYGQTWTYKAEKSRLYTTVTIYNRQAGLPHLLEYGHALVAGGRQVGSVSGKSHIEPVEQKLVQEYEREVINKL